MSIIGEKLPHAERPSPRQARAWLLCSTAILLAGCMAVSPPAWADNECGGIVAGSVTCTPAGNDYSSGITYDPVQDLTMVVQDGVTILAVRLTYAEAAETRFTDAAGGTVTLAAADSLAGEAAVRLGLHLPQELGFADLHLEAGLHHEMRGKTEAQVSDLFFTAGLPGTLGLLSAGASAGLFGDAIFLSLDLGYARGEDAEEITATGALRMIF